MTVQLIKDGLRVDGRRPDELRPFSIKVGVIRGAAGSCFIEWGRNKILAAVQGPREVLPRHEASPYGAIVRCRYAMAPFSSLEGHGRAGPTRRSIEISKVIAEALEGVILREAYPNTAIDFFIDVLEGDGSTRCIGITAAGCALAAAGIEARGIPLALSAGKIDGVICIDMSKVEDNFGEADMPIALLPHDDGFEIILAQLDGAMTRDEISTALEMVLAKAHVVRDAQLAALRAAYGVMR